MDEKIPLPKYVNFLAPAVTFLIFFGLWEFMVRWFEVQTVMVPAPTVIISCLFGNFGELAPHLWETLCTIMLGFLIGAPLGILIAALIANYKLVSDAVNPFIIVLVTTPLMTLLPILAVWMGFDIRMRVVGTIIQCFPIINMNACTGFLNVPYTRIELMQSLKASRIQRFFQVTFLSALPSVFTGLKLGSIFATTGCIAVEYVASTSGIGNRIQYYTKFYKTEYAFACIFLVAAISVSVYSLLSFLEKRIVHWKI